MPSDFLEHEKDREEKPADVAKLVDALDLGSSAARHGGSSPSIRTKIQPSFRDPIKKGKCKRVFIL